MDKLKKTIELIESHQNTLDHYVVDPGVNLTVKEMFDVLIIEIERLRKEKEWLINGWAKTKSWFSTNDTIEVMEEIILKEMQQAIKDG